MVYRPSDLASVQAILDRGGAKVGTALRRTKARRDLRSRCGRPQPPDGRDEVGTLRTLTAYRVTVDRLIVSHRGRLFEDHWRRVSSSSARRMRCGVPGGDDRGSG